MGRHAIGFLGAGSVLDNSQKTVLIQMDAVGEKDADGSALTKKWSRSASTDIYSNSLHYGSEVLNATDLGRNVLQRMLPSVTRLLHHV